MALTLPASSPTRQEYPAGEGILEKESSFGTFCQAVRVFRRAAIRAIQSMNGFQLEIIRGTIENGSAPKGVFPISFLQCGLGPPIGD